MEERKIVVCRKCGFPKVVKTFSFYLCNTFIHAIVSPLFLNKTDIRVCIEFLCQFMHKNKYQLNAIPLNFVIFRDQGESTSGIVASFGPSPSWLHLQLQFLDPTTDSLHYNQTLPSSFEVSFHRPHIFYHGICT